MRGHDEQTTHMFSYLSPEQRVPADHPLRAVRALTDEALQTMSRRFASLYATTGRPSIPPEHWLRALLLQVLYTVRSERLFMEELTDNLLFRWFVGLNMDDPVWHPTTFTKNRDRLLSGDVAAAFFEAVHVPHPVPWAHICAMPPGVAHTPRAPRSACDTQASRDARSGCTAPRRRPRRPGRPRGSERFGRGSLAP